MPLKFLLSADICTMYILQADVDGVNICLTIEIDTECYLFLHLASLRIAVSHYR